MLYDSGEVSDEPVRASSFFLAVVVCGLSMGDPAETMQRHGRGIGRSEPFETYEAPMKKDVHIRGRTWKSS